MANAKHESAVVEIETNKHEIAASPINFREDAGKGMEGATQESFAIPFLGILQKLSPQVDESSGQAIEGAKAGQFFENVTGRLFDGKKGVLIVPCAYKRTFIRWGAKDLGGGFKGELSPEAVAEMRESKQLYEVENRLYVPLENGSIDPKKSDQVNDTRNHYILLIDEETGAWNQALVSLSVTQIKKSKMLMAALSSVKVKDSYGMYTPANFSNYVRATSVTESNGKGSWFGWRLELAGRIVNQDLYASGKSFFDQCMKGGVEAKYEAQANVNDPEKF
jgi:hypothetical protein